MNQEGKALVIAKLAHYMRLMNDRSGCYKDKTSSGKPVYPGINCEAWLFIHLFDGKCVELYNHPEESLNQHHYYGDKIEVNTSITVGEDDGTTSTEDDSTDIMELDPTFYNDATSICVYSKKEIDDKELYIESDIPLSLIAWIEFKQEL